MSFTSGFPHSLWGQYRAETCEAGVSPSLVCPAPVSCGQMTDCAVTPQQELERRPFNQGL